jgi:hypothetical protein
MRQDRGEVVVAKRPEVLAWPSARSAAHPRRRGRLGHAQPRPDPVPKTRPNPAQRPRTPCLRRNNLQIRRPLQRPIESAPLYRDNLTRAPGSIARVV